MQNSKDFIIETATSLFLQKSYHEVTMQDIVGATGLSKGAFYHYFSSKEKVFEEVVRSFFGTENASDLEAFAQGTFWEFCEEYVNKVSDRIKHYNAATGDSTGVMRANQYTLIFDAMKLLPTFREEQLRSQQLEVDHWITRIAAAKRSGEITAKISDEQIAKLFIYHNYGIGVYYVLRSQLLELTDELHTQFKILYSTLKV